MWQVHHPGTAAITAVAAPPHPVPPPLSTTVNSNHTWPDSFLKDGRKFHIGDCALFQAGKFPPFIGVIRCFTSNNEGCLKLGVTWLYRPSDVNLVKGILLKAIPNEVFYSFHKDEISAESLLHPCKVAFLRKGVELPSGISSFVCWRLYDTTKKCLRWLTDTDYIDELREEVDQLLDRTLIDMHATLQSGVCSPKQLSGHLSSQHLKSASDCVQNNSASLPSQAKGKKRGEKGDQGLESMKRERSVKADDGDSGNFRLESMIKAEVAKIADKGGLANNDAVEKLVQLMQLDRGENKIDLAGRVFLADVIASTDRNDCLVMFVQLKGIPVLDDWLQEAHKGKNGDGNSPKEGDKSVEELLLALLRALDKLPVNLNALQTCNIGKSVNHLRSHKNLEIQKKARSLVDTWKKRVDAEMTKIEMAKLNEAKSIGSNQAASWPGKAGLSEVSVGGNKHALSTEVVVKSTIIQPSTCKSLSIKNGHGDSSLKSNSATLGSLKLPSTVSPGTKDLQTKVVVTSGTAELPLTMIKDEKSGSSSQSQNHIQSFSNDHAKTVASSSKEDLRGLAAGSTNISKATGGTSRHRRPSNCFVGTGASGAQKDTVFIKSNSLARNTTSEKALQSGLAVDRTVDVPADHGNSHRLIVRLLNPGRSPTQNLTGGSLGDPSVTGSRASSPGVSEKNEHDDHKTKIKGDVYQADIADVTTQLWQSNETKRVIGSDCGDGSPTALPNEECSKGIDDTGKALDPSRDAILSEPRSGKPFEVSLSSINALIENCVRDDKNCVQFKADGDSFSSCCTDRLFAMSDGEKLSKSDMASPNDSPGRKSLADENPFTVSEGKTRIPSEDVRTQIPGQPEDNAKADSGKNESSAAPLQAQDDPKPNVSVLKTISLGDSKSIVLLQETKSVGEHAECCPVSVASSCKIAAPSVTSENTCDDVGAEGDVPLLDMPAEVKDGVSEDDSANQLQIKVKAGELVPDGLPDHKKKPRSPSAAENKSVDCLHERNSECSMPSADGSDIGLDNGGGRNSEKVSVEESSCSPFYKQTIVGGGLHVDISTNHHLNPFTAVCPEDVTKHVDNATASASAHVCLEVGEIRKGTPDCMTTKSQLEPSDDRNKDHMSLVAPPLDIVYSPVLSEDLEKDVMEHHSLESASDGEPPLGRACETEQCSKSLGCKSSGDEAEVACSLEASSTGMTPLPDLSSKLGFDLNEGFSVDEGNMAEPVNPSVPGSSSAAYLPCLSPFNVSPMSSGLPFRVTVAAPAKGSFVPPEIPLKGKGEGGWKGSAATSAFRPAEPRKVLDIQLCTSDPPSSYAAAGKKCRPSLNIDLNVPDERALEDIASQSSTSLTDVKSGVINICDAPIGSGGLDLDLNRVDESTENGQLLAGTSHRLEVSLLQVRSGSKGFPGGEANVLRDFDLNNGPSIDEVGVGQSSRGPHMKGSGVPFLPTLSISSNETGNLSSWFVPGNSYSAVAIPSFLPDRGEQPYPIITPPGAQRMLGSASGGGAFGSDFYRGPVLSSSPAITFSPVAAFSYAGFPFGSSFPFASSSLSGGSMTLESASGGPCFSAIPTPPMGPAAAASSPFMRPYIINLPEGTTSGNSDSSRKWGWQSLDLNAGPGSVDIEGREDRSSLTSRQLSVTGSQAFAEVQARMYQTASGGLKRKEPEGGWDAERFTYKSPWQ